jgi:hypothetical protein
MCTFRVSLLFFKGAFCDLDHGFRKYQRQNARFQANLRRALAIRPGIRTRLAVLDWHGSLVS